MSRTAIKGGGARSKGPVWLFGHTIDDVGVAVENIKQDVFQTLHISPSRFPSDPDLKISITNPS
jgi:hypothetical protein